jgi:hypothetical protein
VANRGILPGTKLSEVSPRLRWFDFKLSDMGLSVGDLVMHVSSSTTIYRLTADFPPDGELVWTHLRSGKRRMPRMGWTKPGTKGKVPNNKVIGCVEITPVFELIQGPRPRRKRTIAYRQLYNLLSIDMLTLAKSYSRLNDFINQEVKRVSKIP